MDLPTDSRDPSSTRILDHFAELTTEAGLGAGPGVASGKGLCPHDDRHDRRFL
jgi:hypothetical protein